MTKIIVIGGGASGLASAITAAKHGASVTILEQDTRPGRKILLSGNGHCNLANTALPEHAYHGSCSGAAFSLLSSSRGDLEKFFADCGILTRVVGKGIYPYSEESSSVLSALLETAEKAGVTIRNNTAAVNISLVNTGDPVSGTSEDPASGTSVSQSAGPRFLVRTDSWQYEADRIILSTGSDAAVKMTQNGQSLAESLGHSFVSPVPALVPLLLKGNAFSGWAGVRARGKVTLICIDNDAAASNEHFQEAAASEGQLQFTNYGISGIPVMDISGTAARLLSEQKTVFVRIDLMPDHSEEDIKKILAGRIRETQDLKKAFRGILPEKLGNVFANYVRNHFPGSSGEALVSAAVHTLKAFEWEVKGTKAFSEAQCVSGGIPASEIDPETFESVITPGLYICGELLDADGICGGFNLSFAFLSGIRAGKAAAGV